MVRWRRAESQPGVFKDRRVVGVGNDEFIEVRLRQQLGCSWEFKVADYHDGLEGGGLFPLDA